MTENQDSKSLFENRFQKLSPEGRTDLIKSLQANISWYQARINDPENKNNPQKLNELLCLKRTYEGKLGQLRKLATPQKLSVSEISPRPNLDRLRGKVIQILQGIFKKT